MTVGQQKKLNSDPHYLQNFSAIWLHRHSLGDARIVSSHLLIGGVNQARAANVVLRLIHAGSCGEAGARTPIMCQNSMVSK